MLIYLFEAWDWIDNWILGVLKRKRKRGDGSSWSVERVRFVSGDDNYSRIYKLDIYCYCVILKTFIQLFVCIYEAHLHVYSIECNC